MNHGFSALMIAKMANKGAVQTMTRLDVWSSARQLVPSERLGPHEPPEPISR